MGIVNTIISDIDDTLFDQFQWMEGAFLRVGTLLEERFGINEREVRDGLVEIADERGTSSGDLFDVFLEDIGIEKDSNLIRDMVSAFYSFSPDELVPYPGVKGTIRRLKGNGFILGVLSEGKVEVQKGKLKALRLYPYFDAVHIVDPFKIEPRSASCYSEILSKLGSNPEESLYIGDNPYKDFLNAKELGILTVRVLTGEYRDDRVAKDRSADLKIEKFEEILNVLENSEKYSRSKSRLGGEDEEV